MKKILYIDALSPAGHKEFNRLVLEALYSTPWQVAVIAKRRAMPESIPIKSEIPENYFIYEKGYMSKLRARIYEYIKWLWILKIIEIEKPDLLIVSSYETISFSMISKRFHIPTLAYNHNNVDEIKNTWKRFFYKRINNSIVFIVFEKYIKEYLQKRVQVKNRVEVMPHIVDANNIQININIYKKEEKYIIYAPSSSNDMNVIFNLFSREDEIIKKNINIIAKYVKSISSKNIITKTYFTAAEYKTYMGNCHMVYIPFREDFNYRISNVANEAIAMGKNVLSNTNEYTKQLKDNYPSLIYLLSEDLLQEVGLIKEWQKESIEKYKKDRMRFLMDHSRNVHNKKLNELLDKYY